MDACSGCGALPGEWHYAACHPRLLAFERNEIAGQLRGQGTPVLEQMVADDPELAAVMRSEMATVSLKAIIADWKQRVGIPHWNIRVTMTDPEFDTEWELMNE